MDTTSLVLVFTASDVLDYLETSKNNNNDKEKKTIPFSPLQVK